MKKIKVLKFYPHGTPEEKFMELPEDYVLFPILPHSYSFKYNDKYTDDYILLSKHYLGVGEKKINDYYLLLISQTMFLDEVNTKPVEHMINYLGDVYIKHSLEWIYFNNSDEIIEYTGISKITKFTYKGIEKTYLGVKDIFGKKDIICINNNSFSEYYDFYEKSYIGCDKLIGDKIGNFKEEYNHILNNFFKKLIK